MHVQREVGDRFTEHASSPWTSAEACEALAPIAQSTSLRAPRIATWNILYFPDASEDNSGPGTDLRWLACAIAGLDVDLIVVQEFKATDEARDRARELIALLNARTGGDWRLELARCEPRAVQHPGFLYDNHRVTGRAFRDIPALNGEPECNNRASPGFAGYFSVPGGPDFHLIAVHMEAYKDRSAREDRVATVARMGEVAAEASALIPDVDFIFAGDFNTTGCDGCQPKLSSQEELALFTQQVAELAPAMRVVPSSQSCSKVGNGGLLDHFVVGSAMGELAGDAVAEVAGICAETQCSRLREWHEEANERLSDHCPVTLTLLAADDD